MNDPKNASQGHVAGTAEAYRLYAKGIHPRVRLNICDYATTQDAPLLFKGGDFAHTEIVPAV